MANLNFLLDQWWLTPAIGLVIGSVAFVAGRLLFRGAPEPGWTDTEAAKVDTSTSTATDERRVASRRGGNPVEVELLDLESGSDPVVGWVVDRSLGGLCLEMDQTVPVGVSAKVRIRNAAAAVGPIPVAIKSCRSSGPTWRVGCEFLKPPTFNVMLLFG